MVEVLLLPAPVGSIAVGSALMVIVIGLSTVTLAEPVIPESVALTKPVPGLVAKKEPSLSMVPMFPVTLQVGSMGTTLPRASYPVAVKDSLSPTFKVTEEGETVM